MSFFNTFGRKDGRPPRAPKRSPTPTSATFPQDGMSLPPAPPSPSVSMQKPLYLCSPFAEAALVKGNFKTIVMLPKYVDVMEWVAVNIFDFYTNLNLFYGIIAECCTAQTCPTMSAGPTLDYTWIDQNRKQVKLAAPTYIDYVMTWVQNMLDEETVFPTKAEPHFNSLFAHFLAFGKEYELLDVKDLKGSSPHSLVGVGALWDKWKDMGILES
ncbi:hypothetical protein EW145_g4334 [Phellinidium pouzarii]|uniref:Mob1/phocein n=1 Tax=Phellinidium pouzarii TaxID=167371 RepID=A0A4S4L447_9AGAM|nr:hypothetical protein EW145_g4334 [Phellinidium pouzarii]